MAPTRGRSPKYTEVCKRDEAEKHPCICSINKHDDFGAEMGRRSPEHSYSVSLFFSKFGVLALDLRNDTHALTKR